jgi:PAS domain S-box-containing protein
MLEKHIMTQTHMKEQKMNSTDRTSDTILNKVFAARNKVKGVQSDGPGVDPSDDTFGNVKELLHNIVESSLDGIVAVDRQGYIRRINRAFLKTLGYEEHELTGKHMAELSILEPGTYELTTGDSIVIAEEYFHDQATAIENLMAGNEIRNRKSYFTRKDGTIIPCEQNIASLYDDKGNVVGAVGVVRNITERTNVLKGIEEIREFLDNIFKTASDGIIVTDSQGFIIMLNDAVESITGYSREALIGSHPKELQAEGDEYDAKNRRYFERLFREGNATDWDVPWRRKDGKIITIERNIALIKDKQGNITGSVATIRDITERSSAQQELQEAKDHLDNLIENSLDCIMVSDKTGYITKVNQYFLKLFGFSKEEIIGRHVMECTPMVDEGTYECTTGEVLQLGREYIRDAEQRIADLLEKGTVTNWETFYFCKNRKVIPVEQNIVCLYNKEGERCGAVAIIRDITQRRKAERELRETKEFLEKVIESTRDGILIVDSMGYVLSANTAVERMSGLAKKEMIGRHASSLIVDDKETKRVILEKTAELFEKGSATYEAQYKTGNGGYLDVECTASMISNDQGTHIAGVAVLRDVSERKRAQREIQAGKEFLEKIIQGSKDGIIICDTQGCIISVNEAMSEMIGLEKHAMVGKHSAELHGEDRAERTKVREKIGELLEKGFTAYETHYLRKDGTTVEVECYTSMIRNNQEFIGGISIVRDITERKKMQQQMLQSEKLRSLGELAGGVAHDFNNVLAAIMGRVQLLKTQFKPPDGRDEKRSSMRDLAKSLDIIERASVDGAEIVRRIQEFSRKRLDDRNFKPVDIHELLDNVLEFTKSRWRNEAQSKGIKIEVQKNYGSIPSSLGSATELREVFTNLINNALDAMPDGGRISIKTTRDDDRLILTIADTGVGIPEAIRDRIFDPFFTTKGVHSTGLGMSISYNIIDRHNGTIRVESEEGRGSVFTIQLPVHEKEIKVERAAVPVEENSKKARILIIEDEAEIRQLLQDIVIGQGHEAEVVPDGMRGLERLRTEDFDLVCTDLGMPGMSGWQVAEAIKHMGKKVPVAVITGWSVHLSESGMREKGINFIIQKPFQINQILKLVQEGLELKYQFEAA